jgi:ABC-2 type transport system ATP-binding protein
VSGSSPGESPLIRAAGLGYDYGRRRVLDAVSFTLARGEVLGMLGPNGAGKSTCLRLLTGYLAPATGSAAICGFDVQRDGAAARQRLGFVPEDPTLYPHLTVDETLRFYGRLKGLARGAIAAERDRICDRLRLSAVRRSLVGSLSRGYRQRVALALGLIGDPPVLILDEPTNGLDPWQIIELRELIADLAGRHAVLVTSHVLTEIERVATRALILQHGRLLGSVAIDAGSPGALEQRFLAMTAPARH